MTTAHIRGDTDALCSVCHLWPRVTKAPVDADGLGLLDLSWGVAHGDAAQPGVVQVEVGRQQGINVWLPARQPTANCSR